MYVYGALSIFLVVDGRDDFQEELLVSLIILAHTVGSGRSQLKFFDL